MASRRSSQLSYSRDGAEYNPRPAPLSSARGAPCCRTRVSAASGDGRAPRLRRARAGGRSRLPPRCPSPAAHAGGVAAAGARRSAAMELWMHAFALPGRVADAARQAEEWGFTGLLVADSQNLTADVWVELALAGAVTSTLALGPGVTNPITRHIAVTASAAATLHDRDRRPGHARLRPGRLGAQPDRAQAPVGRSVRARARASAGVPARRHRAARTGGERDPLDR